MRKPHFPRAVQVPFSSVVGSIVTLHDTDDGHVIGQIALLGIGGDSPAEYKETATAMTGDLTAILNSYDSMLYTLILLRDDDKDAALDKLPRMPASRMKMIEQALESVSEASMERAQRLPPR